MEDEIEVALEFQWAKPPDDLRFQWDRYFGEFLDMAADLQRVAEEIQDAAADPDIHRGALQLLHRTEAYFHVIYQLRERVIQILTCMTGKKNKCAALKKPSERTTAATFLAPLAPEAVRHLLPFLASLDEDIKFRNDHIHNGSASFALRVGKDRHDFESVLFEIYRETPDSARLREALQCAISKFADRYCLRIKEVYKGAADLIDAIDPWTARSKRSV